MVAGEGQCWFRSADKVVIAATVLHVAWGVLEEVLIVAEVSL